MVAPFLPDEEKVAAIRDELPATGAGIYLDTATAGPLPIAADRAMREWADWELRLGRIEPDAAREFQARADEARGTLAAVLVAPIERVSLAPSVGTGLRHAAADASWHARDRVLLASSLEPAVRHELDALAWTVGAEIDVVDPRPGSGVQEIVDAVGDALTPTTRLVAVPHVSPTDGGVLPLADLAERTRSAGAVLAVDGSLAVGAIAVDAPGSGAEIYATAGDRWLCGPSGTAAVFTGGGMAQRRSEVAAGPDLNRTAVVGLGRSAGWLAMQVGLEWASTRARRLLDLAASSLSEVSGLSFVAAPGSSATILSFRLGGWPADRLREELGRRVFALVGVTSSADAVRVSVGCWNTEDEIRRFAAGVAALAATTPEEAERRRPAITVIGGERP